MNANDTTDYLAKTWTVDPQNRCLVTLADGSRTIASTDDCDGTLE